MLIACSNCATSPGLAPPMLGPATRCAICGSAWLAPSMQAAQDNPASGASEASGADLEWSEPPKAISDPVAAIEEIAPAPVAAPARNEPADIERDLLRKLVDALDPAQPCPPPGAPMPVAEAASALDIVPTPVAVTAMAACDMAPKPFPDASALDVVPERADGVIVAAAAIMPAIARMPPVVRDARQPQKTLPGRNMASFARRPQRLAPPRQPMRLPRPGLPAAILALIGAATVLIAGRSEIVHHAPQTASLYAAIGLPVNLRALVFESVTTARESHDGIPVLVVEGNIVSNAATPVEVPRLHFGIRKPGGLEIYSWTALPDRPMLAPGEQMAFRSRLASPPAESNEVMVRFLGRHDTIAGLQ
jgi:hypothetical protein